MEYRLLKEEDYNTLLNWWELNRFPPPPRDLLPNNGLDGIMVSKDGVELCAGFFYETTSNSVAWIEFIVANFDVKDRQLRTDSQNFLINTLVLICKKIGKKYIFSSLKNEGLIARFKDCEFSIGSTGTTEVFKIIA